MNESLTYDDVTLLPNILMVTPGNLDGTVTLGNPHSKTINSTKYGVALGFA